MKKILFLIIIILYSNLNFLFGQNLPQCYVAIFQDDHHPKKSERLSLHIVAEDQDLNQSNIAAQDSVRIDRVRLYVRKKGVDKLIFDVWSNQLVKDFSPLFVYYKKPLKAYNRGFKIRITYNSFTAWHTYITDKDLKLPDSITNSERVWLKAIIHDF